VETGLKLRINFLFSFVLAVLFDVDITASGMNDSDRLEANFH